MSNSTISVTTPSFEVDVSTVDVLIQPVSLVAEVDVQSVSANIDIVSPVVEISVPSLIGLPSTSLDWWHYIGNTKFTGTTVSIPSGDVMTYAYSPGGLTVYRYITTAITGLYPTNDSYYTSFDGTTLTGLLVTR